MTMMRPLRLMILHFSQIGFTDERTFKALAPFFDGGLLSAPDDAAFC